jgi:hypothetical protein
VSTDREVIEPIWYFFDLVHRRIQNGGWTGQVTSNEFRSSQDIAGITVRLTAGRYREITLAFRKRMVRYAVWKRQSDVPLKPVRESVLL